MKIYKYNGELNIVEDNSIRMFLQQCSMRGVVYDSKFLIECNNFGIKLSERDIDKLRKKVFELKDESI